MSGILERIVPCNRSQGRVQEILILVDFAYFIYIWKLFLILKSALYFNTFLHFMYMYRIAEPFDNISRENLPKKENEKSMREHEPRIVFKSSHSVTLMQRQLSAETVRAKQFSAKKLSLHRMWNRLALALTNKWSKSTIELVPEWNVSHLTIGIALHLLNGEMENP